MRKVCFRESGESPAQITRTKREREKKKKKKTPREREYTQNRVVSRTQSCKFEKGCIEQTLRLLQCLSLSLSLASPQWSCVDDSIPNSLQSHSSLRPLRPSK